MGENSKQEDSKVKYVNSRLEEARFYFNQGLYVTAHDISATTIAEIGEVSEEDSRFEALKELAGIKERAYKILKDKGQDWQIIKGD